MHALGVRMAALADSSCTTHPPCMDCHRGFQSVLTKPVPKAITLHKANFMVRRRHAWRAWGEHRAHAHNDVRQPHVPSEL
jgi:hypothetical protein